MTDKETKIYYHNSKWLKGYAALILTDSKFIRTKVGCKGITNKCELPLNGYKRYLSTISKFKLALFRNQTIFRKSSSCLYRVLAIFQDTLLLEKGQHCPQFFTPIRRFFWHLLLFNLFCITLSI